MFDAGLLNFSNISNHPHFFVNFSPKIHDFRVNVGIGAEQTFYNENDYGFSGIGRIGVIFKKRHGFYHTLTMPYESPLLEYMGFSYQYGLFMWSHIHILLEGGFHFPLQLISSGQNEDDVKYFNIGITFRIL